MSPNFCVIIFLVIFGISASAKAQMNELDFVVSEIKNNYPGYSISPTNRRRFEKEVGKILKKEKDIFLAISRVVNLFKDKHLGLFDYEVKSRGVISHCDVDSLIERIRFQKSRKDLITGFWVNDYENAIVFICRNSKNSTRYRAFMYKSKSSNSLMRGDQVFFFEKKRGSFFTQYIDPELGYKTCTNSYFKNKKTFIVGPYSKWTKIENPEVYNLDSMRGVDLQSSISFIDSSVAVFHLPDFGEAQVRVVDSLVRCNKERIMKLNLLIIDVRHNMGGTVRVYETLTPFVYTQPIIKQGGMQFLSERLIAKYYKQYAKSKENGDSVKSGQLKEVLLQIERKKQGWLTFKRDTLAFTDAFLNPLKVAIIVNYACMSATELMLFDWAQSRKVQIFGERTAGAVDFLDFYTVETPVNKYYLNIPETVRITDKDFPKIDNNGIVPDIIIPDSVKNWIDFVINFYEKN